MRDDAFGARRDAQMRYLCDGAIMGTVAFVNGLLEAHRWRFGPKRSSGAR